LIRCPSAGAILDRESVTDWRHMAKRKAKQVEEKLSKKRRFPLGKLLVLLVIGGGGAIAWSEPLRNKALDALFGAEEEFQYVPPTTGESAGAAESETSTPAG
jgi:hypothetical protein